MRLWWNIARACWRSALIIVLIVLSLISALSNEYGPATYMLVLAAILEMQRIADA
jgi:hypothetical protein